MESDVSQEEFEEFHDDTIDSSINDSTKHLPSPRIQVTWELAPGEWNQDAQTALWFCLYDIIFETSSSDTRYVAEIYNGEGDLSRSFYAHSPLVSSQRFFRTYDLYWSPLISCNSKRVIHVLPEILNFIMEDVQRIKLPCYAVWGNHFDEIQT